MLTAGEVPVVVRLEVDEAGDEHCAVHIDFLPEIVGDGDTEREAYADLLSKLRECGVATVH